MNHFGRVLVCWKASFAGYGCCTILCPSVCVCKWFISAYKPNSVLAQDSFSMKIKAFHDVLNNQTPPLLIDEEPLDHIQIIGNDFP